MLSLRLSLAPTSACRVWIGYCPLPVTVYIRVLLRAIYNHINYPAVTEGGSTEGMEFEDLLGWLRNLI